MSTKPLKAIFNGPPSRPPFSTFKTLTSQKYAKTPSLDAPLQEYLSSQWLRIITQKLFWRCPLPFSLHSLWAQSDSCFKNNLLFVIGSYSYLTIYRGIWCSVSVYLEMNRETGYNRSETNLTMILPMAFNLVGGPVGKRGGIQAPLLLDDLEGRGTPPPWFLSFKCAILDRVLR
jgi:hypothetical protein